MTTIQALLTEDTREQISLRFFGRSRSAGVCVTCGSKHIKPKDFRDAKSRRDYQRSKMCQSCQDEVVSR